MNRGRLTGRHREQARSYSLIGYIRVNQVGQSDAIVGMPPRANCAPTEDPPPPPLPFTTQGRALARLQAFDFDPPAPERGNTEL